MDVEGVKLSWDQSSEGGGNFNRGCRRLLSERNHPSDFGVADRLKDTGGVA